MVDFHVAHRSVDVVDHLGKEAAEVDRVGAGQTVLQYGIHEGRLDHGLAVVEGAVDFIALDVPVPACELLPLPFGDASLGEEDLDGKVLPAMEGGSHGSARVAARRDEDREVLAGPFQEGLHAEGEEAGTEVLEGRCGPVEELEHAQPLQVPDDDREVEGLAADVLKLALELVALEEGSKDAGCEKSVVEAGVESLRQARQGRRDEESSVVCEALEDGLAGGEPVLSIAVACRMVAYHLSSFPRSGRRRGIRKAG